MSSKQVASILVFCVVAISTAAASLPTVDCGSKAGKVISIDLDPAPQGQCTFPRGKNVTAIIKLQINEVTNKLTAVCKGKVVVWVPFNLPNPDACTQGVTCPTTAGATYTFKTVIPILDEYPKIRVPISMEFKDDKDQDAVCFEFPGVIC